MAQPKGVTASIPSPIGGWNTRDGLAVMEPQYAVQLDNIFPSQDGVSTRDGYSRHDDDTDPVTALDGEVSTLYGHHVGSTKVLLAYTPTSIYDATGSVPDQLGTSFSSAIWSVVTIGSNSIMVNGVDTPQKFDGTTLSANSFTGISDPTQLIGLHVFKDRLFGWLPNTQEFWYLDAPDAISGAMAVFPLQYVTSLKGSIIAMATWTFDGGNGVDDQLVILFDSGQVVVYQGSDPGDVNNWALVGTFTIPAPIGVRAVQQYGGDVIIATAQGHYPLSKALPFGNLSTAVTVSDIINPTVSQTYAANPSAFGWEITFYGHKSMLIVNVPSGGGEFVQHVMNTRTNAWCRFTKMNARTLTILGSDLYFAGKNGLGVKDGIYRALSDLDSTDDGTEIVGYCRQAYNNFQNPTLTKLMKMVLPTLQLTSGCDVFIGFGIDFNPALNKYQIPSVIVGGVEWDSDAAEWDDAEWADANAVFARWIRANGKGKFLSFEMEIHTSDGVITWFNTSHLYEVGGVL